MEAEGLIERRACPTDRRSFLLGLTDKGRAVLDEVMAIHLPGIERYFTGHLSATQLRQLEAILRTLRDAEAPEARP
jgi:DNA-binding MarR family transcriptional regulator